MRKFITTWPPAMYAQLFKSTLGIGHEIKIFKPYGCFDRTIHGVVFGMHAIRRMAEKKIAPSQVLHVVAHGKCIGARHPKRIIFYDQPLDLAVVTEKISKKILNVGMYSTDIKNLNEATPEQEEAETRQKEEAAKKEAEEKKEKEKKEKEELEKSKNDPTKNNFEKQSVSELLKSKQSHEKLIREHKEKLENYKKEPDFWDNNNLLKNISVELRKKIISGRIYELEGQIKRQEWALSTIKAILKERGVVSCG